MRCGFGRTSDGWDMDRCEEGEGRGGDVALLQQENRDRGEQRDERLAA